MFGEFLKIISVVCGLGLFSASAQAQATGCGTMPEQRIRIDHFHGDLSSELGKYNGQSIFVSLGPDVEARLDTRGKGLGFPCLTIDAESNGFGNGQAVLDVESLGGLQSHGYLFLILTDRITIQPGAFAGSSFDSLTVNSMQDHVSWNSPASFRGLQARVVQFGNGTGFQVNPEIFKELKATEILEMWSTPMSMEILNALVKLANSNSVLARIDVAWYQAAAASSFCGTALKPYLWSGRHHVDGLDRLCP